MENPVAEADDEKLDTTEHRLSSLVSIAASRSAAAEEEEIKTNNRMKTISELPTRKQPKAKRAR